MIHYGLRFDLYYPEVIPNINGDECWILFVGASGHQKGFFDLIIAFERFRHPLNRLLLIGSLATEKLCTASTAQQQLCAGLSHQGYGSGVCEQPGASPGGI